ncbi:ribbon-helix-helix protein, CopG family [candidate division KSB1 bacterium]|nr:ribbon-helix-helix protein, CopG family [candidate division KSB1 bacterium]NIR73388.1 ribbon-helix-helix protein, CopG family [candidate division KSB1 bacterium]NIS28387.1 ribbon-helix-helix protein, CopG family [candidate division KSB1 bacterium]NIT75268.1 ribbon-helix-helix protein, CopG family [candidate division KSB1 bacterium]NIU29115.1 ribbon-helix-helix protein, CopG family [candidate division KSB1 bacterium]
MKTLTLKLPEILDARLSTLARKKGLSRSEVVRRALMEYFSNDDADDSGTFLDLARDLAGSIEGPRDLSTNKTHLEGYGK